MDAIAVKGLRIRQRNRESLRPYILHFVQDDNSPYVNFETARTGSKTARKQNLPWLPFFALFSFVDCVFLTAGFARAGAGGEERYWAWGGQGCRCAASQTGADPTLVWSEFCTVHCCIVDLPCGTRPAVGGSHRIPRSFVGIHPVCRSRFGNSLGRISACPVHQTACGSDRADRCSGDVFPATP